MRKNTISLPTSVEDDNIITKIRAHRTQFYSFSEKISLAIRSFSRKEKLLFGFFIVTTISSLILILSTINQSFMVSVPLYGGTLIEGVDGTTPRFLNPVLSLPDANAEKDIIELVYSGLMRVGKNGTLIYDLAESYTVSEDQKTYTFTLKRGLEWSDGQPITADDVVFTIKAIQDPKMRSPKKSAWEGVTVEKIDKHTLKFVLGQPYAPFLENTTIGIIPLHIWGGLEPEQFFYSAYNTRPVGSGPFVVSNIQLNSSGIPVSYTLSPSPHFILGKPYLDTITFKFYPNYEKLLAAYQAGEFSSIAALSPESTEKIKNNGNTIMTTPLPRIFSVFFNQNQQELFLNKSVRKALDLATDKDTIITKVFFGYATKINGPLPSGVFNDSTSDIPSESLYTRITEAKDVLDKDGWKLNTATGIMEKTQKNKPTETLSFSLSISDNSEMKKIAELLKENWEKIGAKVTIKTYEDGDLLQAVIRPRKYEALLSGEIIGRHPDLYAYWHSSQRLNPGLNMSLYANVTTDNILEKLRGESDQNVRFELYKKFLTEINNDTPAIFLYSPNFIYVLPSNIQGVNLSGVSVLSDRFANIYEWSSRTQRIWKIFATTIAP